MRYRIGEKVLLSGKPGEIRAVVRPDDDPRKCVPAGERFVRRGDIPERAELTYLVRLAGDATLKWSHGQSIEPDISGQSPSRGRSVFDDAAAISDGTMASLTGLRETRDLQRVRQAFVQHVVGSETSGQKWDSWTHAWCYFVNGDVGDELPAYDATDRLFLRVGTGEFPPARPALRSPFGSMWVLLDENPLPRAEATRLACVADGSRQLLRVGFIRRYWFVGRIREQFDAWLAMMVTGMHGDRWAA